MYFENAAPKEVSKCLRFVYYSWSVNNQKKRAHVMLHTHATFRLLALHSLSQTCCLFVRQMKQLIFRITIQKPWTSVLYMSLMNTHTQTHTRRKRHVRLSSYSGLSERGPIAAHQNLQREPIVLDHASVRCGKLKLAQFYKIRSAKKSNIIKSLIEQ